MFSRYKISSVSEMKEKIKNFICITCGMSTSTNNLQVFTKNNEHILWFMDESYGISVWITDFEGKNVDGTEVKDKPYFAMSTAGLGAKYVTDEQVTVLDEQATAEAKADAYKELEKWKIDNDPTISGASTVDVRKLVKYEQELARRLKEIEDIQKTKKEWKRLYDTNIFHVGGAIRFSDVPLVNKHKFLDCHYNDGIFGFFLFSDGDVKTTNTLIIGEYTPSYKENKDNCFILSNTFHIVSEDKRAGYDDSFKYESIIGIETFPLKGEKRVIHYNNELFRLVQYEIDNEPIPEKYSVNGVKVGYAQNIAPVHIQVWNLSLERSDWESKYHNNIKVLGWYWRELHCTYECEESNVGVNTYPLLDTQKKSYKQYDPYITGSDPFDTFMGFKRCGTGGNSVNTNNNISEIIPMMFYVLRDPDDLDSWSSVGMTDKVGYINMYNMSSGRTHQSKFRNNYRGFSCYDLYKRRCQYTPWSPNENEYSPGKSYQEAWGFGGYPGVAFQLDDDTTENALATGRGRMIG